MKRPIMINNIEKAILILMLMLPAVPAPVKATVLQQQHPSLIPLPQSLQWTEDRFPLDRCKAIVVEDASLKKEAASLLKMAGRNIPVKNEMKEGTPYVIRLNLGKVVSPFGS